MKKFSESHEWVDENGYVGISNFAQSELGDIVYVELPEIGKTVSMGQEIIVLESTKAAADVYSPVSGVVSAVNEKLKDMPELVNQSPEQDGWLVKLKLTQESELNKLMDSAAYDALIAKDKE